MLLVNSARLPSEITRSLTAKAFYNLDHLQHLANVTVPERQRLLQLVARGIQRWHHHIGLDFINHHAHLVGLLPRLVDPAGLAELDQHALGTSGDRSVRGLNQ